MAETLTESFCERCGTRYEFKAPTRLNPLRKTRGLIGGLKNYVMSQDALSDAVGDAMRSEEERLAAAQLEAFHESFNFCIDCRQYTCLNCWNDAAGRCRSCAPIAGTDDLAERLAASFAATNGGAVAEPEVAPPMGAAYPAIDSWPTTDLPEPVSADDGHVPEAWPAADGFVYESQAEVTDTPARASDGFVYEEPVQLEPVVAEVEPEPTSEPEPVYEPVSEPEPVAAEVRVEPEPVYEPEPVAAEVERETDLVAAGEVELEPTAEEEVAVEETRRPVLRVVAWDEDADFELEPEPEPVAAEVEVEPEPVAAEVEPEPVAAEVEPEPEPVAAEVEPEPEPVAAEVEVEAEPVAAEVEVEAEPVAAEVEAEPVAAEVEVELEPVAADVEVEPEPEPAPRPVAPRTIAPISETILRFPQRPAVSAPAPDQERVAAEDDSPEIAARRAQLDLLGLGDPGEGPVQPTRPAVLPYRSRGAAVTQGELAARAAAATGSSFWEASAREVASAAANVGVQNCGQCGLSLSANARFCRRCGTRQAQSA